MQVRYIEIKTSPEGQTIKAYTPAQYKKEMTRRKNAAARARKLTRLQERVGAVLAMLGFLMLLGAGGMCEIGQIIGYGLAGLFLFVFGVCAQEAAGDGAGLPGQNCAMEPVPVFESDL